jgi:hypothetical protein
MVGISGGAAGAVLRTMAFGYGEGHHQREQERGGR